MLEEGFWFTCPAPLLQSGSRFLIHITWVVLHKPLPWGSVLWHHEAGCLLLASLAPHHPAVCGSVRDKAHRTAPAGLDSLLPHLWAGHSKQPAARPRLQPGLTRAACAQESCSILGKGQEMLRAGHRQRSCSSVLLHALFSLSALPYHPLPTSLELFQALAVVLCLWLCFTAPQKGLQSLGLLGGVVPSVPSAAPRGIRCSELPPCPSLLHAGGSGSWQHRVRAGRELC